MKAEEAIKAAYDTFIEASALIPAKDINKADALRIEGALDALNWVLGDDEIAEIFDRNIERFRQRVVEVKTAKESEGIAK